MLAIQFLLIVSKARSKEQSWKTSKKHLLHCHIYSYCVGAYTSTWFFIVIISVCSWTLDRWVVCQVMTWMWSQHGYRGSQEREWWWRWLMMVSFGIVFFLHFRPLSKPDKWEDVVCTAGITFWNLADHHAPTIVLHAVQVFYSESKDYYTSHIHSQHLYYKCMHTWHLTPNTVQCLLVSEDWLWDKVMNHSNLPWQYLQQKHKQWCMCTRLWMFVAQAWRTVCLSYYMCTEWFPFVPTSRDCVFTPWSQPELCKWSYKWH